MSKKFLLFAFTSLMLLTHCGRDPLGVDRGPFTSQSYNVRGSWQFSSGSFYGDIRNATLEINSSQMILTVRCGSGISSVSAPIEIRENFIFVRSSVSSVSNGCVSAIGAGDKSYQVSGNTLYLSGPSFSSTWRR